MRSSPTVLSLALALGARAASLLHSVPEDLYAFPKYRVTFLNGLPVLNDTAEHWLQHGLRGGELEFLEQPWADPAQPDAGAPREIGYPDREHAVEVGGSVRPRSRSGGSRSISSRCPQRQARARRTRWSS
jgi:hypothetical protein